MGIFHLVTFSTAFTWVIAHGYILMFIAMLIEGPIITAAAAFAVALGYFSIPIVFMLALLGDIIADIIYYLIGYFSRITIIEKYGKFAGLSQSRMKRIEKLINSHPIKTLVVLKLMPILPTPGLMIVGSTRMKLKKFITISSIIILPKTIFFLVVGYYFGEAYSMIMKRFEKGTLMLFLFAILLGITYYLFNKFTQFLAKKIEKI